MDTRSYDRRYAKEYGWGRSLFYRLFLAFVVLPAATLQYKIKIEGRENLQKGVKYLYAGNHTSYLDPPFVALAVNAKIAFMAKQELFTDKNKVLQFLVKNLGAFAVDRDNPKIATFKTVIDLIKTDWSFGIFPEGKICKTNSLETIQKGFTMIAKKAKIDVMPVAVIGFDGYAGKSLLKKQMTVKIGKPISYKLPQNEIIKQWAEQICEFTGYENKLNLEEETV
jgi:1-acyl-sn-glycerol-3-phosphate acyltransferase